MPAKPMKDFAPGEMMFTVERIGNDDGTWEVREVFYLRDPDGTCRHRHNVRIARIGIAQGEEGYEPRYARFGEPCRDPGEADGRTLANRFPGGSIWARRFETELSF